eukprot:jgi/Psemu1/242785/estExt_Genewise1.C_3060002
MAGRPNYDRCDNKIVTAKYTLWSFLPVAIREQFRRFANVYFLCIGLIMCLGKYTGYFATAMSPWTTIGPLAIVISVSLAVEGYSDIKRHRSDEALNSKPRLVQVAFQKIKRMNIRQGHIILIRNREAIPVDTIILASSGENGCAYIETSSIDGETNLKLRNSPTIPSIASKELEKEVMDNILEEDGNDEQSTKNENVQYIATLTSEPPNSHINTFSGKLTLPPFEKDGECIEIPLDAENILLRGAVLRNTEWVLGISCFTGKDTKLIQNSFRTPSKFSRIDVLINKCVVLIVVFMCLCILYLSIKADFVMNESFNQLWYVGYNHNDSDNWPYLPNLPPPKWVNTSNNILQNFFMFVTLLSNFVPLSMYVTLEMVNFFCLWLVYVDREMYDAKTDTRAIARSTNVTDLGQVQYIFSDKTGTLTQNVMRFKRCSVDGMIFGAPVQKMRPQDVDEEYSPKPAFHPTRQLVVGKIKPTADGSGVEASKGMTFNAEMFVRVMSLCHTVVSQDGAPAGFAYQAESPDESALVSEASKTFGFQVVGRNSSGITLQCEHPTISRIETWEILAINKFDSERKRMSILLRAPPELGSVIILFCKGADSAMLDSNVCTEAMLGLQSHLGEFASEGLRTLVLGVRFLKDMECNQWLDKYKLAAASLKDRDKMLKDVALEIERDLHIVGATAVEDRLQTGVPDTIATLEKAGIKLWVLTGDKKETAIEIGYSTKVLTPRMHLTEVADQGNEFKRRTVLERLFAVDRDVRKGYLLKHLKKGETGSDFFITPSGEGPRALIIEGSALKYILGDNQLEEILFNIASECDAVIACRVSPQQKALLVKLVRHHVVPQPVTLAIGDGANDVGMIQEAHVGVGISGKEGKQAVNASDFAISQFRFLETLLLIHGRWDFMRQATVVLFSFYKNAVMAGCLIVYNGSTLYSGQTLFDQWVVSTFNFLVFFPIYFLGIFDRCLEKDYIRKNPEVYKATRQNEVLTMRILFRWIIITVSHIVILYYGCFYYLSGGGGNSSAYSGVMQYHTRVGDGEGSDLQSVGLVIFSSMVILLAYKVLYESRTIINGKWPAIRCWKSATGRFWSRIPYSWYGILYGSLFFYFLFFLPIYEKITTFADQYSGGFFNMHGVVPHVLRTSSTNYISILFIPIAGMAFDVCWKVFSNMYYPTQTQIHVEIESKNTAEQKKAKRDITNENQGNGDQNSWYHIFKQV